MKKTMKKRIGKKREIDEHFVDYNMAYQREEDKDLLQYLSSPVARIYRYQYITKHINT